MPPKKKNPSQQLITAIIEGIEEKKGKDIVQLDMRNLKNSVTDFFIICHGDSSRQADAIADTVEEFARKKTDQKPLHKEGSQHANWILLDYSDVIVHIFNKEYRDFYNIEGLWADADRKDYNNN